jgi:dienelactone hydrolase
MSVVTREATYEVAGRRLPGFLADGSGGKPAPGVLVAHEGRGFTQHPRDRAVMLAELGCVAYAPDYYGEQTRSLEHSFELMSPFAADKSQFVAYGQAAMDVLKAHPSVDHARLAAIGFCWGGFAVLELACYEDLKAVVGFHPGLSLGPCSAPERIKAKVLICVGDRDPYVPALDRERFMAEMNAARVDTQVLLLLGAPHSFTNPEPYHYEIDVAEGVGYDPVADRRSWAAMRTLFAEALGL